MNPAQIKSATAEMRADIKHTHDRVLTLKKLVSESTEIPAGIDRSEMIANATLAYRHLEDARMRLGKMLQALDGGTSCYDNKSPV